MKNFKVSMYILVLAGVFSCRKYEDGPDISFQSKDARLKGVWDVELFYINGYDSTSAVKNQPCYFPFLFKGLTIQNLNFSMNYSFPIDTSCSSGGSYGLIDDNSTLSLNFKGRGSNLINVGPLYDNGGNFSGKITLWKINKLTNKELWLETIWNNQYCILHLKK